MSGRGTWKEHSMPLLSTELAQDGLMLCATASSANLHAIRYYTVLYCTVLCYTKPYYTIPGPGPCCNTAVKLLTCVWIGRRSELSRQGLLERSRTAQGFSLEAQVSGHELLRRPQHHSLGPRGSGKERCVCVSAGACSWC